jgi:hypothetical protein
MEKSSSEKQMVSSIKILDVENETGNAITQKTTTYQRCVDNITEHLLRYQFIFLEPCA